MCPVEGCLGWATRTVYLQDRFGETGIHGWRYWMRGTNPPTGKLLWYAVCVPMGAQNPPVELEVLVYIK